MEKSVAYSVVVKRDFKDPEGQDKLYYAQAQARGEMNIREISQRIQQMCTVTYADVMAVLTALPVVLKQGLAAGEIVRLGDLGSLQIGLRSKGASKAEGFTPANILKAHIRFRAGKDLTDVLSNLTYTQVPVMERKKKQD